MPNWRVMFWMKLIEAVAQLRPKSIWRLLRHPDPGFRAAMRWYYAIGRRVWPYEVWNWLFRDRRRADGPTLGAFLELDSAPRAGAVASRRPGDITIAG